MIDDTYPPLAAWLHDERVAELAFDGVRGVQLTYTATAIERFGLNGLALSASLPVRREPYGPALTTPYLDRLLPEGAARSLLERRFGVPRGDTFHLLEALGRDCAGAVVILDADDDLAIDEASPQPLSDGQIAERIAALPTHPLGVDDRVRLSLAGMQAKLLLTRLPTGYFALPVGVTPSTHIIKPTLERFPGICANEAWCLALARRADLPAAKAEVDAFGDHEALVVERYDRTRGDAGAVRRVHQEDACQALGIPVPAKYEYDPGGPTLRRIATLLRRIAADPAADLERLAAMVVFAVAIGNADLHGRNVSLLYGDEGPTLAPVYDAIATVAYDDITTDLGMSVGQARSVGSVTATDLVAEISSWGITRTRAARLLEEDLDRLEVAVDHATDVVPAARAVADIVRRRLAQLRRTN